VKLPDGVKDADVETIIQINGEIKVIPTAEMEAKMMDTKKVIEDAQNTNKSAKATLERLKNRQKQGTS
jgi:ribosomal 30S subunit maturation factor RimM